MFHRNSINFTLLILFTDLLATVGSLFLAISLRLSDQVPFMPVKPQYLYTPEWLWILVPILWGSIFLLYSVYDSQKNLRIFSELFNIVYAIASAALILAGILYFADKTISRGLFIIFILVNITILVAWRILLRILIRYSSWPVVRPSTIIVGAGLVGQKIASFVEENSIDRVSLTGYIDDFAQGEMNGLPILGTVDELANVVETHNIDNVIIALPLRAYERVQEIVVTLRKTATQILIIPDYFNLTLYQASAQNFGGIPLINLREPALTSIQRVIKRIFDIVVATLVLIFICPIMLIISVIIKLDSHGDIIFKQTRIGENGKSFKMYKFRSMVANAPQLQESVNQVQADGTIAYKVVDDPRVTRIGKFIRRTSLDELPQLFNVIKGDMSLVGPRPEMPWLVEKYEPWQRVRFSVPQGMTGWWQVNGRSDKPMHLNTNEDLYYIQHYSIWMDCLILLKTPLVVLMKKGAY